MIVRQGRIRTPCDKFSDHGDIAIHSGTKERGHAEYSAYIRIRARCKKFSDHWGTATPIERDFTPPITYIRIRARCEKCLDHFEIVGPVTVCGCMEYGLTFKFFFEYIRIRARCEKCLDHGETPLTSGI
jgi:hypothetical protein